MRNLRVFLLKVERQAAGSLAAFGAVVKMISLGSIAVILTTNFLSVLACGENGLVSNCTLGTGTLHLFHDKLLVRTGNIHFAQNKDQIVILTNVASF